MTFRKILFYLNMYIIVNLWPFRVSFLEDYIRHWPLLFISLCISISCFFLHLFFSYVTYLIYCCSSSFSVLLFPTTFVCHISFTCLLSSILIRCPSHCNYLFSTVLISSSTSNSFRVSVFRILSSLVISFIFLGTSFSWLLIACFFICLVPTFHIHVFNCSVYRFVECHLHSSVYIILYNFVQRIVNSKCCLNSWIYFKINVPFIFNCGSQIFTFFSTSSIFALCNYTPIFCVSLQSSLFWFSVY